MYNVYLCFSDRGNRKYSRRYVAMYDDDNEHRHENQPTLTDIIRPTHSQTPADAIQPTNVSTSANAAQSASASTPHVTVPPPTRPSAGVLFSVT